MTDANFTWVRFFRQAVGLALVMFSSLGCYLVVLKWRGGAATFVTHSHWDDWLPYQPVWVWVYLVPYLIGPLAIGFVHPATFRWFVSRGIVVVLLSLLVFMIAPTRVAARPTEHGLGQGLTAAIYENMVAIDEPPANAAPSLHVSLTCLLAFALVRDFPRWWPVIGAGTLLVWLATLLTRQHHLLDVGAGIVIAVLVTCLWPMRSEGLVAKEPN